MKNIVCAQPVICCDEPVQLVALVNSPARFLEKDLDMEMLMGLKWDRACFSE